MNKITFTHFVKLMTNQAYYVWNNNDDQTIRNEELLEFDIPSFHDVAGISFSEVQAKSFAILETKFMNKIEQDLSDFVVIKSKKIEEKIIETKKAMNNNNIKHLINPVFSFLYKGHLVLSQPRIYSKTNNQVTFLKLSTSTKLKDILKIYFDYWVMKKIGINVEEIDLFIIATKKYKRNEVDFFKTKYLNTVKNGRKSDDKYDFLETSLIKSGQGKNKDGNFYENKTILEIVSNRKLFKSKNDFLFFELESYLEKIIAAKKSEGITPPVENDASLFGNSDNWETILKKTNNPWFGFSGHLVPKKDIIKKRSDRDIIYSSRSIQQIMKNKIMVNDNNFIQTQLGKLVQKVIWYDFEAFSLPFCPIDSVQPFHQVVFQVSIIKTDRLEEKNVNNLVFDPQKINSSSFVEIINAIHSPSHHYVVFNKSYEISRLEEMLHILEEEKSPSFQEAFQKVQEIIAKTIDLADFFVTYKNRLPKIMIPHLKGKHSIKKIEQYISDFRKDLSYKIKSYETLNIKNGLMAMDEANHRALGITGDKRWQEKVEMLKEYCENDVRAMIMTYFLLLDILQT